MDEVVHPSILRAIAIQRARSIGDLDATRARPAERRAPLGRAKGVVGFMLEGNPLGRAIVLRQARAMVASKTQSNYPALPAAIRAIAAGFGSPGTGLDPGRKGRDRRCWRKTYFVAAKGISGWSYGAETRSSRERCCRNSLHVQARRSKFRNVSGPPRARLLVP